MAQVVERDIQVALIAPVGVPVGDAMTGEDETQLSLYGRQCTSE
jgi:hypothetical protein